MPDILPFFVAVVVVACIIWFHRESWWCFLLELFFFAGTQWMNEFWRFSPFFHLQCVCVCVFFVIKMIHEWKKKSNKLLLLLAVAKNPIFLGNWQFFLWFSYLLYMWVKKNWISKMMMIMMAGKQAVIHTCMHACTIHTGRIQKKKKRWQPKLSTWDNHLFIHSLSHFFFIIHVYHNHHHNKSKENVKPE